MIKKLLISSFSAGSLLVLVACSYNERVREVGGFTTAPQANKSLLSITLVDNGSSIEPTTFNHGMATLKYDFNDGLTKGVRDILNQSYQRVDISSTPDRNNDLYAILKAEVKAPTSYKPNDVTLGLSSTAQLDVYETSTGRKLDTYYANKSSEYHRPAALNGYLIVTMLSAFTLTPITMPLAVDVAGKYVSSIINDNLKGLLSNLATEVKSGSATIKDEPQFQRGPSSQSDSGIERLLGHP